MNKDQRNSNRTTSRLLNHDARKKVLAKHVCENCGEFGGHWVAPPQTLADIVKGREIGFWTCNNPIRENWGY